MRSLRSSQHLLPVHRLLRACVSFVPDLVTSSLVVKGHSQARAADRRQAGQHQAGSGPQQPPLLELLASLGAVYRSLAPPLSLGELVFGLQVLVKQHSGQRPQARDQLRGRRVRDPLLLHRMLDDLDLAQSCYRRQQHLAAAHCRIKIQNMVAWQPESSYLRPGYWLGVDHCQRQVVWAVRGTRFLADLITDLTSAHPYMQGHTHWGMQHAARWLLHREQARVQDLLAHLPGYRLHLVGHSLGGGIASLIAHMAHNCPQVAAQLLPPEARGQQGLPLPGWVRAVALAPPCVMTQHMAHSCRPYVTSIIMTDDLVPRLNAHTLGSLRRELLEVDWAGQLLQQLGGRQVMQGVRDAVQGVRQAVGLGPGLLQLAQALLPPDLAARWAVGGGRLVPRDASPQHAAEQLVQRLDSNGLEPTPHALATSHGAGPDSGLGPDPEPGMEPSSTLQGPEAEGWSPRSHKRSDSGGNSSRRSSVLASLLAGRELLHRLIAPGAQRLATPLLNPPPVPADASSAAASAEQHLPSGNNNSGGHGFSGSGGNTVGRTTAMDLAPNTTTSTSSEPDLTRWAEVGRAAVHGLNAQLASLSPRLPAAAKDALVAVFSATNVAEVLRVAGVLTTQTRAWQAKPGTLGPPSPKRASQSPSPNVEGGQEGRHDAPAPVLLPAGQLYHVRPAAADAEAWEVVEVDVEAPYFDRVLLTSSALKNHRSRAYRQGLTAAIQAVSATAASNS